eukprot:GAFH01003296.1.p1 GENE.GAFH01003296.1~~GAFH01003296.1.p1  ORF type:complete len:266 (-),score=56.82 GAFH01003296.1:167-856(-)
MPQGVGMSTAPMQAGLAPGIASQGMPMTFQNAGRMVMNQAGGIASMQQAAQMALQQQQMAIQEQAQLASWFQFADTDHSGKIEPSELNAALAKAGVTVSPRTTLLMVRMFDTQRTGTVDFGQFSQLWRFIQSAQRSFTAFDRDGSGRLDLREVHQGITQTGFSVSEQAIVQVMKVFDREQRGLDYGQFLELCVFMGLARSVFGFFDGQRTGQVLLNFDSFLTACSLMLT